MIRWSVTLFSLLIGVVAWTLFHVSYEVRTLESDLRGLNRSIVTEQQAIAVLEAEWAYLNRPDRLGRLAHDLTRLQPMGPDQVLMEPETLPYPLPVLDIPANLVVEDGPLAGTPFPPRRPGSGTGSAFDSVPVASTGFATGGATDVTAATESLGTDPGSLVVPVAGGDPLPLTNVSIDVPLTLILQDEQGAR